MPKVYDKDGRELTVWDRVRVDGFDGEHRIRQLMDDEHGLYAVLDRGPVHNPDYSTLSENADADGRIPDLQLIDQPNPHTKEAASAAPEGAER